MLLERDMSRKQNREGTLSVFKPSLGLRMSDPELSGGKSMLLGNLAEQVSRRPLWLLEKKAFFCPLVFRSHLY